MELLVYKASAGSGKTFTLAVEYIRHLIIEPHAYQQILAVTFTNKATTEMKERILQQLYGIWKKEPASKPYIDCIQDKLHQEGKSYSDEELSRRAGVALQYILHDYSRFRVETIDSFFQSVMRNLARELELSPNLNIELNNDEVLSDAVDSLIEKLSPGSPVLAWLLDYINERIADDKQWNVSDEIKKFSRNIFNENYIEKGEKLRKSMQSLLTVKTYRETLEKVMDKATKQCRDFYDEYDRILQANHLAPEDLIRGKSGIHSYFCKLRDGKLSDKEVVNKTMADCLDSAENWASKSSKLREQIIRVANTDLLPLLQRSETMRPKLNCDINSCKLSLKHLNKLRLLNHIDEVVRTQNRDHNRFLLSDTNALLHKLVQGGDSSFVFEKTGANIRNVMIDEFQDTSRMQWHNFRLLLLEGLSQGGDSLIVGDVKQSIYRWRSGDWGILNSLGNSTGNSASGSFPFPVRIETLSTNRRSEPVIIWFNNRFFVTAVKNLNQQYVDEQGADCLPLKQAYADVVQSSSREEEKGYVRVSFLKPDEEHDYTEMTLMALGEEVKRLLEGGLAPNDITILVRKNKNIPLIADYFDKELHLTIVSDEAFRLDASVSVNMLMDALRYLSNPEDEVARSSLILNYNLQVLKRTSDWDALLTDIPENVLPPSFIPGRETLRMLPLYELLEELFRMFEMNRIEKQDAYLFAFFDAVTEYLQDSSSELDGFIRYWEETLCGKTIPSGELEGIRILSIHKSKGLEFHTVLVPFCDWKMESERNDQLVWCTAPQPPYNQLDLIPITYSAAMAQSVYKPCYLEERMQLWVDNLNLLYVAFTRPTQNLNVWGRDGQSGTISELMEMSLPEIAQSGIGKWDEESLLYEYGSCSFIHKSQPVTNKVPVRMDSMLPRMKFRQSNRSADFIAGVDEDESGRQFINRGRLLHTLFSTIETESDAKGAVDRLVFEGVIGEKDSIEEIRQLIDRAFALPQVKEWYSGKWQLFNECNIIWMEDGVLCNRRPDRVMVNEDEIVVVDFKFGKPNPKYNRQVQAYMQLIARMDHYEHHSVSGFLWYVEEGRIEKVANK